MKKLMIVESPAKCKTIQKYLGADWIVKASMGHIADLPQNELGVDKVNAFRLSYEISEKKRHVVKDLTSAVKEVGKENVFLATDPDREGEAISFHLCRHLNLDYKSTKRVTFNEITESLIQASVKKPRNLDIALVSAQEARRAIDRLVGYEISPLLWRKIESNSTLSAGRVQSVAVKLVVEREREIEEFIPKKSIKVSALFLTPASNKLKAQATFELSTLEDAKLYLQSRNGKSFQIVSISKTPAKKNPQPPFSTSTLQQDANKKLKFSVSKTMQVAQTLYEEGYITYMRTDSVNLSDSSIESLCAHIESQYGREYVERRKFKNKNESAQEAHEAIRPTKFNVTDIDGSEDEKRLYRLIYMRAVASQMKAKETLVTTILINTEANTDEFQAKASLVTFDGYSKAYEDVPEEEDEDQDEVEIKESLEVGQDLKVSSMTASTGYSRPKSRFDEATLVRELEALGIGRPSTYAPIIKNIKELRKYIELGKSGGKTYDTVTLTASEGQLKEEKGKLTLGQATNKLLPTEIGIKVVDFLTSEFSPIMNYEFTASCEDNFDKIASGKERYVSVVSSFYTNLDKCLLQANANHGDITPKERKTRDLGAFEGKAILVGKGEYGVYVKHNDKFYNVADETDPGNVSLEVAISVIKFKREADIRQKEEQKAATIKEFKKHKIIQGKYGPYITNGKDNAPVPKNDLDKMGDYDEEKCKEVIKNHKQWKKKKK